MDRYVFKNAMNEDIDEMLNEYYSGLGFEYVEMVQEGNYTGIKREKKLNL